MVTSRTTSGSRFLPLILIILFGAVLALSGAQARAFATGPESDITREGTAQASTTSPGFPASWAIDNDPTTSWFSTGPEPGGVPTRFTWTHGRNDLITTVFIHSNGQNKTQSFQKNFGFGNVVVQVLNAANQAIWQQSVPLPGTPDPDVTVHPNVVGRSVQLLFTGHESKDCGGISELRVMADRTPPTATLSPTPTDVPPTPTLTVAAPAATAVSAADTATPTLLPTATATDLPAATPSPTPSPTSTGFPNVASGATIVALNPIATPVPASGMQGDCDGDGKLTESDALCALEMSVSLRPVRLNMDMDNSGDVNSRDAVIILQKALGK